MEAPPASAFEVIQSQLVLQLLIVAFDPPAQHCEPNKLRARRRRRQRREPILDRRGVGPRPFDEQPLIRAWRRSPVVAMRGPHPDRREARAHRAPCALAPGHGLPSARWQSLGQGAHAEGVMTPGATYQRRWPAVPAVLRRWQRGAARRPHGGLRADPDDVRNVLRGQRIAKRGDDTVAGIGAAHGCGRDAVRRELRDLLEGHLPFCAELQGLGHPRRSPTASGPAPSLRQIEPIGGRKLAPHSPPRRSPPLGSYPVCRGRHSTGARRRPSGALSSGSRCRRRPTPPLAHGVPGPPTRLPGDAQTAASSQAAFATKWCID